MALTREQLVDTAFGILRDYGLADLSMRRLARDLGVQVGALYWHVKNKQELLGVLSVMILARVEGGAGQDAAHGAVPQARPALAADEAAAAIRRRARDIRNALLGVRDGAEVVALTHALDPDALPALKDLEPLFAAAGMTLEQANWAGNAVVNYILGAVSQEQTRNGLIAAGLLPGEADPGGDAAAFNFGLDMLLAGTR
ncbi:AcrR family transcriptional regulator [Arthrobacter stackebrandtii]|uniref:AcrR family transcriptional regulator n=1 Tax=Arthrobacter stackebrandtii TaxID=272161 RepID=A0ABS4Z0U6_9MICC|nr:TetR/AcrR family transcriptional regulator C-terminal domain-containing protein [Arthrobacter stackebrandtii]MBP2414686.1 AcrR family transcriptional regulator [Arthrobacter stackebrandtii]PYH01777.1 TetR family transcriptional regulator [Arthrobacter stackebrandtii]